MEGRASTYGFIGLGQMGHGMAKNIRQKITNDSTVVVYDINYAALEQFVKDFSRHGPIIAAGSPKEVAELADIVMTSVPAARHVKDVFLNPQTGLLAAQRQPPNKKILFMELSTIDAAASIEVAEAVIANDLGDFVDAPCSGGAMGAEAGTLSFMIGCPIRLYPQVLKICKLMGKESSIFRCGDLGAGLKTKVLNNYLSALTALATAETINIGIRGGLDPKKLNEIINASSGQNFNSSVNNPVPGLTPANPASHGYRGGFSIELCLGVLELAVKAAEDLGAKTVLAKPMLEAYTEASRDERFKGKDSKVIYQYLARPNREPIPEAQ